MQKIHQLHQCFLSLVLTCYIGKAFACLRFHIDLGITLAEAHSVAAHALAHKVHKQLSKSKENQNRQYPIGEKGYKRTLFLGHNLRKFYLTFHQAVSQLRVLHSACNVNFFFVVLINRSQTLIGNFYLRYLAFIHHLKKIIIGNLLHFRVEEHWHDYGIEYQNQNQHQHIIIRQWPFFIIVIVHHFISSLCFISIIVYLFIAINKRKKCEADCIVNTKSVKKSHSPSPLQEYLYTCVLSLEFTCRFLYN